MGLKAKFSSDAVARKLNERGRRVTRALRNRLGEAAKEFHQVMTMLVPHKTGTLRRSIRITKHSVNRWTVWINEDQKVPSKRGAAPGGRETHVRDYLLKIESGDFEAIGPRSRQKEAFTDKRKLAGLRVRRSPQGSYVGGIFFGRTMDALAIKWNRRFEKVFKDAMERGFI